MFITIEGPNAQIESLTDTQLAYIARAVREQRGRDAAAKAHVHDDVDEMMPAFEFIANTNNQ